MAEVFLYLVDPLSAELRQAFPAILKDQEMATSKQAWLTRSDDQTSLWIGFFYHQVTSAERLRPVERLGIELAQEEANKMDGIIYLVGLVVVVMAVLSLLGLH